MESYLHHGIVTPISAVEPLGAAVRYGGVESSSFSRIVISSWGYHPLVDEGWERSSLRFSVV